MKQHRTRDTWQILCICAALHACTSNRSPSPQDLSGTVIQGAGDKGDAGDTGGAHADAGVGNGVTGNGNTPQDMMSGGTGGSPANTGSGGQPATTPDAGMPSSGSGGNGATTPPMSFDAGVGEPDDDDDDTSPDASADASTDAGVDAGPGFDDDDELP